MGKISIIDTGKLKIDNTGTTTPVANSGSSLELDGIQISYTLGNVIDSSPEPSVFENTQIVLGSIENATLVIEGILDQKSSTEMDKLKAIRAMIETKGIKVLFYSGTSTTFRDITNSIADVTCPGNPSNVHSTITTEKHLHAHAMGLQVTQTSQSGILRYRLSLIETN